MSRKRRSFSSSFKAKVALSAARGDKTLAELASQHGVYQQRRACSILEHNQNEASNQRKA